MPLKPEFEPQPKQNWIAQRGQMLPFLVPLQTKEILLTGNRGGGKSDCLLVSFLRGVGKGYGPAWKGYLFKRTVPEVGPLFEKAKAIYQANCPGVKWTQHPYCKFVWPTGEMLTLRHMLDVDDYADLHGSEVTWIGWEELTNWATPEVYLRCMSLLRSAHPVASQWMQVWSSTNPGQVGHCLSHGEVLTADRGWVDIKDMAPGDSVVTVDSDGVAKVTQITDVVKEHYEGDLVERKGTGIYMQFTPNHRLPHCSTDYSSFTLKPYTELPGQAFIKSTCDGWQADELESFTVPAVATRKLKVQQPDTLSGADYAELMGWFLSEGCTVERDKAFSIAQMKERGRVAIRDLLTRAGFKFSSDDKSFTVYSPKWYSYFRQFGKCRDKFIPQELKQAGPETLSILLKALMAGDGCGNWYYTISKQLADDVCEITVKLGYRTHITQRQRANRKGLSYQVSLTRGKPIELVTGHHKYKVSTANANVNVTKVPFVGNVYCLTVPETETFFVRQNGCVWLSGNTWVKRRWQLPEMQNQIIFDNTDASELARWSNDALVNVAPRPRIAIFIDVRKNDIFMKANPTYLADLAREAPNDATRRAWIDGSWDIVSGGMFDDVWDIRHHVVQPFPIPKSWKIDRSMDWGSSTPFAILWYAESDGSDYIDANGQWRSSVAGDIFVIYEWYGTTGRTNEGIKMVASDVAKGIVEREIEWGIHHRVIPGPADNQINSEFQAGTSMKRDMDKTIVLEDGTVIEGVQWTRSDKTSGARITGWNMIRDRLKCAMPDPEARMPREHPGLFFMNRLKYTLQQFHVTPRDDKDTDDIPKKGEYHIQDSLRYRIMSDGRSMSTGSTVGMH